MADTRASESRQTEVLVVAWVMTGLAICTVAFKLFARVKVVKIIGWDDFFIILSLVSYLLPVYFPIHSFIHLELSAAMALTDRGRQVCSILASAFVHYGVTLGFGRHTEIVAAEYGLERLFRTAKFQMLGYRKLCSIYEIHHLPYDFETDVRNKQQRSISVYAPDTCLS